MEKHYHAVQFYKDETSLAATVAQFLADGLSAGQPGLVIATPSHTEIDRSRARGTRVGRRRAADHRRAPVFRCAEDARVLHGRRTYLTQCCSGRTSAMSSRSCVQAARRARFAPTARWSTCCGRRAMLTGRSRSRFSGISSRRPTISHCCAATRSATSTKKPATRRYHDVVAQHSQVTVARQLGRLGRRLSVRRWEPQSHVNGRNSRQNPRNRAGLGAACRLILS